MAQRTRLFQQAGSPLIQGQSKMRRPFWQDWVWAAAAAVLLGGVAFGMGLVAEPPSTTGAVFTVIRRFAEPLLWLAPTAAFGALVGVWVAAGMGWRRRWPAGALVGFVVALGAIMWVADTL